MGARFLPLRPVLLLPWQRNAAQASHGTAIFPRKNRHPLLIHTAHRLTTTATMLGPSAFRSAARSSTRAAASAASSSSSSSGARCSAAAPTAGASAATGRSRPTPSHPSSASFSSSSASASASSSAHSFASSASSTSSTPAAGASPAPSGLATTVGAKSTNGSSVGAFSARGMHTFTSWLVEDDT
ncbi:uncharacterized protein EV422DRAFT_299713 [Fimicolochytrium jonesii]|uniref:uncharacterized protein n=1 Tax=Fimicolochytrium jonesii TaxID=1396493 RepID=UPI0022FDF651|nr:uncharacterized protein EV422DRAFT_299713 [Fimicolochytrium jonesii]KAI8816242.1 hypothetical protein EV422DRAFT_299713 [Fimicolochytrium jonesii]